jgi:hypothetical protein
VATEKKRTLVDILPEWEGDLDQLKRQLFYDKPKAEMMRFIIALGIQAAKAGGTIKKKGA